MNWKAIFFALEGRLPRLPFWLASLAVLAATLLILVPAGFFRWDPATDPAPLYYRVLELVVTVVFAYPTYAIMLKRLYDRDHPGTAAFVFIVLDIVAECVNVVSPIETDSGFTPLGWVLMIPLIILLFALVIELGLRRGTRGPNRFGPDPLVTSS
ncbi:MAG TPA: DUF805 domain-containing protein [Beijerinckiaceae bacterium]|nr:DUF805 domain-containing protein [Beijerinckiaceae bacterium]